ncbi:hypothetical protein SS1G_13166 [Sclerotinia sclerotiorum 1980 UF-70]|uniref:Ketopantoate reductase C-terminal domain-containing protein n=1 Tax=Sclerotinia sclerotiorum (strain ATCC 18683 / 1980 / Ss-1) TaxID=665079 RepID=A7F6D7_SCLS1|nr:hypothetical protein SS1G_13166 [Sclerotinia sclerotiorum 1980 UF-70]EDN98308.1 hypothetical protein SS1G_13166 [Sclerotinia sclerotiorum 1980 UF-70]
MPPPADLLGVMRIVAMDSMQAMDALQDEQELYSCSEEENNASLIESASSDYRLRWEADMKLSPGQLRNNFDLAEPANPQVSEVGSETSSSSYYPVTAVELTGQESPAMPSYQNGQENLQSIQQANVHYKLPSQYSTHREDRSISRTVHVLGTGPIGQFIAYNLAGMDCPPPVTLLMHRPLLIQQWHQSQQVLRVFKDGIIREQSGFNVELSANFNIPGPDSETGTIKHRFGYTEDVIDNLIITTNGDKTVAALTSIKHRLRPNSTICFVQHGAGVIEDVNKHVFPNLPDRPHYMLGNLSHGLFATDQLWTVAQTTQGQLKLTIPTTNNNASADGLLSESTDRKLLNNWAPSSRYLLMVLNRSPQLEAIGLNYPEFMNFHLEYIAVNSVIGPLSVIFDCSNDHLLYNFQASQTMKFLLNEISQVLKTLPELATVANVNKRFGHRRLTSMVLSVLARSGENVTSMLHNVRKGMRTDIDFYNGYLARRAKELEIPFTSNELVISMVKAKQAMKSREMNSHIPVVDRR